ncbi:MAG: chorismate--pyruvate lyase family protein [Betaproteobacteria bacterium]
MATWLREPGSLTARCQRACQKFGIRLLSYRKERSLLLGGSRGLVRAREVLLECDGEAVIFAHTEMSTTPRGRLTGWLRRLGTRSLGSLLFSHPGFEREPLEFCRLDERHTLFQRAVAATRPCDCKYLWARRSLHRLGRQEVLVTEVFLPALLALNDKRARRL